MDFVDTVKISEEQMKALDEAKEYMLNHIEDFQLRVKIRGVFDGLWDDLCKIPASKSLRYHHKHENIYPGGMINHLLRSLWFAVEFLKETGITDEKKKDHVYAGVMTHDLGVLGRYRKYVEMWNVRGRLYHGTVGSKILREKGVDEDIQDMVHRHMSHWEEHWVMPKTSEQWIVAYSDYMASREEININGMKVIKEKGV